MTQISAQLWRREESRVVRPFKSANDYLDGAAMRLHADQEFSESEFIEINISEANDLSVVVKVPALPAGFEEVVGIPASELALVVSIENRYFMESVLAINEPLNGLVGSSRTFELSRDLIQGLSWAGELKISLAVVLSGERHGAAGTATRVGSWVAKKTFSVGRPKDTASFPIDSVEPSYFESRGLPKTTTYLVEINDTDLNQSCQNLPDLVKVSVNSDILALLARDDEAPISKALVKSIYVDVVSAVLATGYSNLGDGEEVAPDGIIGVATDRLVRSTGVPAERLKRFARDNSGCMIRAVVQADVDFSRALINAAQRR